MELKGEDLWSYSRRIDSVSLRKCPYDRQLISKTYLSAITVTGIFSQFYLQDGSENKQAQIRNEITSLNHLMYRHHTRGMRSTAYETVHEQVSK